VGAVIKPRPYQVKSIKEVRRNWREGLTRQLLVLATGLGKTVVAAGLIREVLEEKPDAKVLFLAHREELLEQAEAKLKIVAPELKVKYVRGKDNDYSAHVIFATIQTISRDARMLQIPVDDFEFVVVDEAHHSVAPDYMRVLNHLGCTTPGGRKLLGLTATPDRTDGVGLDVVFDKVAYKMSILRGIVSGYLCDLRAKRIEIDLDLSSVGTIGNDFDEKKLARELMRSNLDQYVVKAFEKHASKRKTVVFVPSIELAQAVSDAFRNAGHEAWAIHGNQPKAEQKRLLKEYEEGRFNILVNAMKLTEGWDCPAVGCVIVARPTNSASLYKQIVGRGTRLHPEKTDCLILDVVGCDHENPKLITLDKLSGFSEEEVAMGLRSAAKDKLEREKNVGEMPAAHAIPRKEMGESVTSERNLFSELNWLSTPGGGYVISLGGNDVLVLVPEKHEEGVTPRYEVLLREKGRPDIRYASDLPLDYAQGLAEDAVRDRQATQIATLDQPWRNSPATEKQKKLLVKLGVKFEEDILRGRASDLITLAENFGAEAAI
jgi:superfamily II DNA or RNA helicase